MGSQCRPSFSLAALVDPDQNSNSGGIEVPEVNGSDGGCSSDEVVEVAGPLPEGIAGAVGDDVLLTSYDFLAEHWKHIRTTNPIDSTFATVRLRTTKTKGCLSRMTALTMVLKLCQSVSKKWRRLDGSHRIAEIIRGAKFKDGEKPTEHAA